MHSIADSRPALHRVARGAVPAKWYRVRGPSGLGDAIYLRPIIEYMIRDEKRIELLTDYPQIFCGLNVTMRRFSKARVDLAAHYSAGRTRKDTTQFRDMCLQAALSGRVPASLPFSTRWETINTQLIDKIEAIADGRKIVLVHGGRTPMGRENDERVMCMLPDRKCFNEVLSQSSHCLLIRVGMGRERYRLNCEMDLWNRTNVADLMDLAKHCDGVIGQCSFAVPLAEIFHKPLLAIWSSKSAASPHTFIQNITPKKILEHEDTSKYVMDDWDKNKITEVVDAFLDF